MAHVVIYSGGMDSYTLLRCIKSAVQYKDFDERLLALSFDYGQRHRRELTFAQATCRNRKINHHVIPLGSILTTLGGSSLTDRKMSVPEGHYASENMRQTVVYGRNTIMLSIALAYAEKIAADFGEKVALAFGAHAGDHYIYPDCRPSYVHALAEAFSKASDRNVHLTAPFMHKTKGDILAYGAHHIPDLKTKDYLETWTCYKGGDLPCGKCGACVERAEAFAFVGERDPWLDIKLG